MLKSQNSPPASHGAYTVARASFGTVVAVGGVLLLIALFTQQSWEIFSTLFIGICGAASGYYIWTKGYYIIATSLNAGGLLLCGGYVYLVSGTIGGASGILFLASIITAGGLLGKKGAFIDISIAITMIMTLYLQGDVLRSFFEMPVPRLPPEEEVLLLLFVLTSLPCWGIYVVAIDSSNRAAWQQYFLSNQQLLEHQKIITNAKQQQEDIAHLGLIATTDSSLPELKKKCWLIIQKHIPEAQENWSDLIENDGVSEERLTQIFLSSTSHQLFLGSVLQVLRARNQREEMRKERAELENRIQKEERLESLSRMAGGVAHDFNNALSVIVSIADEFASDPILPSHVILGSENILEATRHASELTKQLLLFSQGIPPTYTPINPVEVLQELTPLLKRVIGTKGTIEIDAPSTKSRLSLPKENLERIFLNLIQNAKEAITEHGIIRVSIHEEHTNFPYWQINVQDNGSGMNESTLDRAIDPYFSSKEKTGLGLSTVHGLIEQVEGTLHITSTEGKGTTVQIKIPISSTEQQEEEKRNINTSTEKIALLIDDEPFVRTAIAMFLHRLGWRVFSAGTREEAMVYVSLPISLIICDIRLQEDNGSDVVQHLKNNGLETSVLYVTGYAGTEKIEAYKNKHLLIKPFRLTDLEKSISDVLKTESRSMLCP